MPVRVKELIEQLQEYAQQGYEDARVYVRCDSFALADTDADYDLKSFDSVPTTGVEEAGYGTGMPAHVIIGREEPDEVRRGMCESGWWSEPTDGDDADMVAAAAPYLLEALEDLVKSAWPADKAAAYAKAKAAIAKAKGEEPCTTCGGHGEHRTQTFDQSTYMADVEVTPCESCEGTGTSLK